MFCGRACARVPLCIQIVSKSKLHAPRERVAAIPPRELTFPLRPRAQPLRVWASTRSVSLEFTCAHAHLHILHSKSARTHHKRALARRRRRHDCLIISHDVLSVPRKRMQVQTTRFLLHIFVHKSVVRTHTRAHAHTCTAQTCVRACVRALQVKLCTVPLRCN